MSEVELHGELHVVHRREDEYSFVLEGRMGAQLDEEIVYAEAGDLVFKPRDQWHTFWNAGDEPCRILELISPAGFERYFEELVDMSDPKTPDTITPIASRYGLEMKFETIPQLVAEHGLEWPGVTTTQ